MLCSPKWSGIPWRIVFTEVLCFHYLTDNRACLRRSFRITTGMQHPESHKCKGSVIFESRLAKETPNLVILICHNLHQAALHTQSYATWTRLVNRMTQINAWCGFRSLITCTSKKCRCLPNIKIVPLEKWLWFLVHVLMVINIVKNTVRPESGSNENPRGNPGRRGLRLNGRCTRQFRRERKTENWKWIGKSIRLFHIHWMHNPGNQVCCADKLCINR